MTDTRINPDGSRTIGILSDTKPVEVKKPREEKKPKKTKK